MGTRENILEALRLRMVAQAGVTTVVRSTLSEIELKRYTQAQFAAGAIFIVEPDNELPSYSGGRHAVNTLDVDLQVWALQWNWDSTGSTQINALLDGVITAIHADIKNGGNSHDTRITGVTPIAKRHPLYGWRVRLAISYYQDDRVR